MKSITQHLPVATHQREELIDITSTIEAVVERSGVENGTCIVFSTHTTCGVIINENADPEVKTDIIDSLGRVFPRDRNYRHVEGNSDAHVKTSTVGQSLALIIENGQLVLGTWQGIMVCEFDGPRTRTIVVHVQGE
ncbi:MAG TPA: secondary thiamine-phosphate synthase enzyme YjbQ [Candidatus Lokiarchaeia archaeon]|nr:secondary thiamine-phosphate synthase enzyme YjbQ [Candidatus Lokiarchaeia archaeon]